MSAGIGRLCCECVGGPEDGLRFLVDPPGPGTRYFRAPVDLRVLPAAARDSKVESAPLERLVYVRDEVRDGVLRYLFVGRSS